MQQNHHSLIWFWMLLYMYTWDAHDASITSIQEMENTKTSCRLWKMGNTRNFVFGFFFFCTPGMPASALWFFSLTLRISMPQLYLGGRLLTPPAVCSPVPYGRRDTTRDFTGVVLSSHTTESLYRKPDTLIWDLHSLALWQKALWAIKELHSTFRIRRKEKTRAGVTTMELQRGKQGQG